MDLSTAKYRITYEAFSKFSASISKAENLDQLLSIVQKKSKYLFDFKVFRTIVKKDDSVHCFTFNPESASKETGCASLFPYERKLLRDNVPFCEALESPLFSKFINHESIVNPILWGWYFQYNTLQVGVSILSDDVKRFVNSDIEILHLVVDTIITKFQELQFKSELEYKNKNLRDALLLIEKKNIQINQIVDNQKEIIKARTKEISAKNHKLLEISKMNAHNVREPLSRILGIVEIIDHLSTEELYGEAFGYLKESAQDLDRTLKKIIAMSAAEIDKFGLE